MFSCISKHAIHCSERHLLVLISPARVESSTSRKTSTRVVQFTGCLPLPVSHSWRISVFIRSASFKCLWAIIFTLDPFLSSRRKAPNWTYLVATSTGMLTTLPSGHVNFSSSGRVGLVPGLQDVLEETTDIYVATVKLHAEVVMEHYREMIIICNCTRTIAISHL